MRVIKLRFVHSIHSQWKSQRMLATYMPRMRNNILWPAILNIVLAARANITVIRPLSSCPKPLFQCEANFEATDKEMIFCSHSIKTRFHKKRFCGQPRFESGSFGTWKWTDLYEVPAYTV